MKKRISSFLMAFLMVVCICLAYVTPAHAEENVEMDIVMVLDQSGSMKKNDPDRMMLEATNMLVGMMPSQTSRAGIITFNSEQTVVQPLSDLSDMNKVADINTQVNNIKYKGETNIGDAIASAVKMFDTKDGRVHAILVLSDGKNKFNGKKDKEVQSDENLTDALKIVKNNGIKIYCLGFGEEMSDTNGEGYKKLTQIATSDNNISTEINPEKIQEFYLKMLSELTGGSVVPITDNIIHIKNNVKEANVYVQTSDGSSFDNIDLSLKDPSGNEIPLNNSGNVTFYKYKYSAVLKFYNPTPGDYTLESTSDKIQINTIYMPIYDYVLSSKLLDSKGIEINNVKNHEPITIQTCIMQDGKNIADPEVYNNIKEAVAIITAKDTGDTETVNLQLANNVLEGKIEFDHEATYDILIQVSSDTDAFSISDNLTITSSKPPACIAKDSNGEAKELEDQKLDKTLKKKVEKTITYDELMTIVEDQDNVGVEIKEAKSTDEDAVEAIVESNGDITLVGKKWGSSLVTVTYQDSLGNQFESSFGVKVRDKLLIAFFAMIPVIIVIIVILVLYLIAKKSRMIRGNVQINSVTVRAPDGHSQYLIMNSNEYPYLAKSFFGRKGTMGTGMMIFAQEAYSANPGEDGQILYQLLRDDNCDMVKNLHGIKIIGSYLGMNGCTMNIKKGTMVSLNNNQSYGKKVKLAWKRSSSFRVFTRSNHGFELFIDGQYIVEERRSTKKPKQPKNKKMKKGMPGGPAMPGGPGYGSNDDPFNFDNF